MVTAGYYMIEMPINGTPAFTYLSQHIQKKVGKKVSQDLGTDPLPLKLFLPIAMESSPQNVLPLLLISSFILAMVSPSLSCPTYCEAKIDETWYLRQVGSGPNQNQDIVVNSTAPATTSFGMIAVNNWAVLVAPDPNAVVLAHARGLHVQAGQAGTVSWYTTFSLVFEGPRYVNFLPTIL
jgi:hypothetical protein